MRIRFIASMSRFAGGTMAYTARLAEEFGRRGHEVVVQSDRRELTDLGRAPYVRPVWTRDLRYPWQNYREARRDALPKAEVDHLQHEYYLYGGMGTALAFPTLLRLLRRLRRPVITTLHGVLSRQTVGDSRVFSGLPLPPSLLWSVVSRLQREIVAQCDAVLVHDPYFQEILIRECGADPTRIRVIPHGVSVDLPCPRLSEARARLNLPADATVLLSFGYLARYKGLETLLDAFNRLGPERPDLFLVVAGGPPARNSQDGEAYRRSLEDRVTPGLRGRLRFTGPVPDSAVPDFFGAANMVVLSHAVPLAASGVLALAQGYGRPVLAPDIPPFRVSVSDPASRYPAGSVEGLAHALDQRTRSREDLDRQAEQSRQDGRRASWSRVADLHLELYEELWARRGPSGL
jgi:glycosyltransferase involved in cell wall biosynthesis